MIRFKGVRIYSVTEVVSGILESLTPRILISVHPEMNNFKGLVLEQGTRIDYQE